MVKPTRGGSALGVAIVRDEADLAGAMVGCFAYADTAMLEAYVPGTEVAVTVIEDAGRQHSGPSGGRDRAGLGRVRLRLALHGRDDGVLRPGAAQRRRPPTACARIAVAAHERLGLRHLSRADLIVGADGQVTFLEVNVAPGCTETSLLPQAVEAAGLDLGHVFQVLVERAIADGSRPV